MRGIEAVEEWPQGAFTAQSATQQAVIGKNDAVAGPQAQRYPPCCPFTLDYGRASSCDARAIPRNEKARNGCFAPIVRPGPEISADLIPNRLATKRQRYMNRGDHAPVHEKKLRRSRMVACAFGIECEGFEPAFPSGADKAPASEPWNASRMQPAQLADSLGKLPQPTPGERACGQLPPGPAQPARTGGVDIASDAAPRG